ncbi:nitrogenase molybdenum-iron protein alpha chain [Clostridium homopropionicum DSM 5847]|uniref:Nitrogenase iron-molybdenum cofactor biosynthesis protein NifE n=1 Tax=Clostridium homopropionicum DSM 5847 TaxID=1121318 RepID=A0A0L6ZE12_9CLOT|nr:nitrogenase iron-molybdenum cofactor biosynthesis protein NifE [Clostridium homopropionicum]KOA21200.1 nitrogenase molybdenum-iron protein alpha chain [Clostridium homopropionicum DSM 5847]SFG27031.1 nitrogenase molybdenum-cofactor synthesis protein NifE [Clostridium homopropionicum]
MKSFESGSKLKHEIINDKNLIKERQGFVCYNSKGDNSKIRCDADSVSGSVSQRACVYCGARVVLNPIADAFHIVHGPIGCASYTWDIRGSLSSGPETYRNSFSTDIRENDVIFGGEKKLAAAIDEIVEKFSPKVIFVYSTCIVGVIGDDVEAVCKQAEIKHSIRVISVKSPGFAGNKSMGYKAACNALIELMEDNNGEEIDGVNFLGDFNLAGEMWIIQDYLKQMGINVVAKITGDGRCEEIKNAPKAKFNIVQCAGSMTYLAKNMESLYRIPYIKVSFFGVEDTKLSLMMIAEATGNKNIVRRAEELIEKMEKELGNKLDFYREKLKGKKAAIYVGGGFKAISLIKQFKDLGMETVMVGTQTGKEDDYEVIRNISDEGTIILDDSNPYELEKFIKEKEADILVGGVKERPLAYKLGVGFCDHNHERKIPLCGFQGALNFAKEIHLTVNSPIWDML